MLDAPVQAFERRLPTGLPSSTWIACRWSNPWPRLFGEARALVKRAAAGDPAFAYGRGGMRSSGSPYEALFETPPP